MLIDSLTVIEMFIQFFYDMVQIFWHNIMQNECLTEHFSIVIQKRWVYCGISFYFQLLYSFIKNTPIRTFKSPQHICRNQLTISVAVSHFPFVLCFVSPLQICFSFLCLSLHASPFLQSLTPPLCPYMEPTGKGLSKRFPDTRRGRQTAEGPATLRKKKDRQWPFASLRCVHSHSSCIRCHFL